MASENETGNEGEVNSRCDTHSRLLGHTEKNWCAAVEGGTGNTVLGILFHDSLEAGRLQSAVAAVQEKHPRLRSQLISTDGSLAFQVMKKPYAVVEVVNDWTLPESDDEASTEASAEQGHIGAGQVHEQRLEEELSATNFAEEHRISVEPGKSLAEEDAPGRVESEGLPSSGRKMKVRGVTWDRDGNGNYKLNLCEDSWLRMVEWEMNTPLTGAKAFAECSSPMDVFEVRLYRLKCGRSLVILRAHTCACDRASAGFVVGDLLANLEKDTGNAFSQDNNESGQGDGELEKLAYPAVEDAIPRGQANKPFWAHGIDVIGYGLSSRRHALLPFHRPESERRSVLMRSGLSLADTTALMKACEREGSNLYGAISAAALLATAAMKALGDHGEHFAVTSLVDCRHMLSPSLPSNAAGFYHSAILNTHQVSERTQFWDLARRCLQSLEVSLRHRKHFTDMGDLNLLMAQAMQHPGLTPAASLRTSMLVLFREKLVEDMKVYAEKLGIEDYVGCSSIHGVGPCLAIFDSIREDGLHLANVFPTPLFSRSQMKNLVATMMQKLYSVISIEDDAQSENVDKPSFQA